jgi:hypothetical protein
LRSMIRNHFPNRRFWVDDHYNEAFDRR